MIKFIFSKNIIYLSVLQLIYYIRIIEVKLINKYFSFNDPVLFSFLMAIGEIIGGFSMHAFIRKASKKQKKMSYFLKKLIGNKANKTNKTNKNRGDNRLKIIILIFFAAAFDFIEFIILNDFLSKFNNISGSLQLRFCSIATVVATLLCVYALKFKNGKHRVFSIICIIIFFVIEFIIEILYCAEYNKFLLAFLLTTFNLMLFPFTDVIERYLGDVNFPNPYCIIGGEGVFIFIMTLIYSFWNDPLKQIAKLYKELNLDKFALLVFLLLVYLMLSSVLNIYKIHCNIFYSPVVRTMVNYIYNPLYFIYTFFWENDYIYKGKKNVSLFIINELISLIFTFFAFVYNEYIILSFCELDHDTNYGIHKRASNSIKESNDEINKLNDEGNNSINNDRCDSSEISDNGYIIREDI